MVQIFFNMFVEVTLYEVYPDLDSMCKPHVISAAMALNTDTI